MAKKREGKGKMAVNKFRGGDLQISSQPFEQLNHQALSAATDTFPYSTDVGMLYQEPPLKLPQ